MCLHVFLWIIISPSRNQSISHVQFVLKFHCHPKRFFNVLRVIQFVILVWKNWREIQENVRLVGKTGLIIPDYQLEIGWPKPCLVIILGEEISCPDLQVWQIFRLIMASFQWNRIFMLLRRHLYHNKFKKCQKNNWNIHTLSVATFYIRLSFKLFFSFLPE